MATTFTSLRTAGALAVGGALTVTGGFIGAALSGTTIDGTVGTFTTSIEAPTFSGGTINAMQANGIVRAKTLSGAKLSGTPTTGSSALVLQGGAKGSHFCVRDTDGAGWTLCDALNGTLSCVLEANATQCP